MSVAVLGKLFVVARRLAEQEYSVDGYRLVVNNDPGVVGASYARSPTR